MMLARRALLFTPMGLVLAGQEQKPRMFEDAEAYERFMGRWSRMVAPPLVELAGLPQEAQVLDVGSGTGSLAFAIAKRHGRTRVLGIDPSKEYVAYAASKNPFSDRVSFETGDAQQLRFGNGSFDAAVSLLVFNFIPDAGKALSEVRRITKSGGSVSAAVWDYGGGMRMLRIFWDAAVALDPAAGKVDEKRMPLCRAGELSALWRKGGLEEVREEAIEITMRFESFADYWDPLLLGQGPAGAYVRGLGSGKLAALRAEVERRVGVRDGDGRFELRARAWAVRGIVPAGR
jgi:SAM-dependent methyltransferase